LECDRCGSSGALYTIAYGEEGTLEFVLCDRHNSPLEKMKTLSYGTWHEPKKPRKRGIHKVDPATVPKKST
jgi:hypothetical protein